MKTFKQFIEDSHLHIFEAAMPPQYLNNVIRQNQLLTKARTAELGRRFQSFRKPPNVNPNIKNNFDLWRNIDANMRGSSSEMARTNELARNISRVTNPASQLSAATQTPAAAAARGVTGAGLAAAAAPVAVGTGIAAAAGEIAQRQQDAGFRRATGALPGEMRGLNPSLIRKDFNREIIKDKGGRGGTVSTNTAYQATLKNNPATITRGANGQRMVRAELGQNKPTPVSILNPNTWSKPETGKSYAATLSGHRGTVTYDSSGNRRFQALMPTKK